MTQDRESRDETISICLQRQECMRWMEPMSRSHWRSLEDIWAIRAHREKAEEQCSSTAQTMFDSFVFAFIYSIFRFVHKQIILSTMPSFGRFTSSSMFLFVSLVVLFNIHSLHAQSKWHWPSSLHRPRFSRLACTPDVCNQHGTCIPNASNSFTCQCDPGFAGPTCDQGKCSVPPS